MKRIIKRIISLSMSALMIAASLNLSLIANANNGVSAYLGNEISLKDTFEYNGISLDDIWETTLYNGENNDKEASTSYIKTNAEVVVDPENSANKALKLGTVSNEKGAVGLFFKSTYIPNNRKIKSFSFDIYLENTTKPTYITYYKGAKLDDSSVALSNAVGLTPVHAEGGHQICANGATCKYWAKNMPVSYGTWFNVKLTYIYQDGRLYGFKLKLGENAEQSFTYKKNAYTPLDCMMESGFTYGFTFGKSASLIDNVAFNYEVLPSDSAELVAGDFRVTFAKVLAISESATTASDKAAVEEALAAFDGLRDDVKALLEAEKAKLDALLAKIKADIVNAEVSAFRTAHSDMLAKTKDTATSADITALNAAVNALLDLSIDAQKALETEKTNLFEISRKLKGSSIDAQILTGKKGEFFDDFEYENGIVTSDIYETLVFSPKDNKRENNTSLKGNIVASPTENSNNVLLLDAADEANAYIYTLNSNYYPLDRQIESISLKYYTAEGSNMTRNVGLVVYSGETNDGNINLVNYGFRSGQNTALVLNGSVVAWTKAEHALPTSAWTDIKVDFIYKNGKLWGFTLALDAGNGPISNTYEYGTFSNALGKLKEDGFKVGLSFGIGETAFVDDIRFSFSKTAQELAAEQAAAFRSTHAGILGKTTATVTSADKAAFDAAFDAYGKLSTSVQALLTSEFALLGEMTEKFYPSEYATMQKFIADYSQLLSREDNEYTKEDLVNLKKAYDAYQKLGSREQVLTAYPYKAKIDSALKYINDNPKDVGNISEYPKGYDIFADFEYGQNPFAQIIENKGQASGEIVADPQKPDNNVFAMELVSGSSTAIWKIKENLWPKGSAQVTKFSFKFLSEDVNNFVTPYIIYEYNDAENFRAVSYQGGVAGKHGTFQKREIVDGISSLSVLHSNTVIFGEWMEMQFTFSGTNGQVLLSNSQGSVVSKLNFNAGNQIGFGFSSGNYMLSKPFYIDDVVLQLEEGDFDLNEVNHGIVPYYQGNTFQNPDETVLITGDSYFGSNVEAAELYTLPDTAIDKTNPQYIFETRFNKSETMQGL